MATEVAPDQPIQEQVGGGGGGSMEPPNGNDMPHALDGQDIVEVPEEMATAADGRPVVGPPYKRGRGRSFFKGGTRKGIACQVPGCDRSLLKLREYYKRYKICAYHLELQCMVVEGQSIRFCQQCGRFQLLDEFDGDRRSCRRKLKKHNERRRRSEFDGTDSDTEIREKKRTSKVSDGRHGSESAGFQPQSSNPMNDMLRGMTGDAAFTQQLSRPMLAALHNAESGGSLKPRQPSCSSHGNRSGEPQIDPTLLAMLADCAVPTAPDAPGAAAPAAAGPNAASTPGLLQPPASPEKLLRQVTTTAAVSRLVPPHVATDGGGAKLVPPHVATDGGGARLQPPHVATDGGASIGVPPVPADRDGAGTSAQPSNAVTNNTPNVDVLLRQLASALGVQPQPAPQPQQPAAMPLSSLPDLSTLGLTPEAASQLGHLLIQMGQQPGTSAALAPPPPIATTALPVLPPPLHLQPPVASQQEITTVSLKLFNSLPSQLPPALLHELMDWMANKRTHMEVAMRPGCVHMTTAALLTQKEKDALTLDVRASALRIASETSLGRRTPFMLQIHSAGAVQAALVQDGAVRMVLNTPSSSEGSPVFVRPLACVPSPTADVVIFGGGLDMSTDKITCRSHGTQPVLEVQCSGKAVAGVHSNASGGWARLCIPAPRLGAHNLDVQRGVLVGAPATFLVLDDKDAVAEIRQLEVDATGVADVDSFLHKVGLIVTHCCKGGAEKEVAARVALVAQEVAAVALRRRWPVLLRMALPAIGLAGSLKAGVSGVVRCLGNNTGLLQAAIASGCPEVVKVLGWWASTCNVDLTGLPGNSSSFAFHLVAMLQNPVPIAEALFEAIPSAGRHFTVAPWNGISPLALAQALNQDALLQYLETVGVVRRPAVRSLSAAKGGSCPAPRSGIDDLRYQELAALLDGDLLGRSEKISQVAVAQLTLAVNERWRSTSTGTYYSTLLYFMVALVCLALFIELEVLTLIITAVLPQLRFFLMGLSASILGAKLGLNSWMRCALVAMSYIALLTMAQQMCPGSAPTWQACLLSAPARSGLAALCLPLLVSLLLDRRNILTERH